MWEVCVGQWPILPLVRLVEYIVITKYGNILLVDLVRG